MATRPDRLFGLLALLSIIAALILTVVAALVAIFVFVLNITLYFIGLIAFSVLLLIPALACHSVFLCCRPANRCPAIAAAVLSGLTCLGLFACLALTGTTWKSYLLDDDYWYGDDDVFGDSTFGRGRTMAMFGVAAGFALLACAFQIVATCTSQPEKNMGVINVPGATGEGTSLLYSSSATGGAYPMHQQGGGYQGGGYPMQQQQGGGYQGGGYPVQQQHGGSYQGGGYPMQQQHGGSYQGGGYPMQQQHGGSYQGGYSMQPMQQQGGGFSMHQQGGGNPMHQQGGGNPTHQQGGANPMQQQQHPMQQRQQSSCDGYVSDGSVGSQLSFTQQPPQQPMQQQQQGGYPMQQPSGGNPMQQQQQRQQPLQDGYASDDGSVGSRPSFTQQPPQQPVQQPTLHLEQDAWAEQSESVI